MSHLIETKIGRLIELLSLTKEDRQFILAISRDEKRNFFVLFGSTKEPTDKLGVTEVFPEEFWEDRTSEKMQYAVEFFHKLVEASKHLNFADDEK